MEMFRNGWIELGKNTQISLELRKRCSTLLKIREMEIKVPLDAIFHLSGQHKSNSLITHGG